VYVLFLYVDCRCMCCMLGVSAFIVCVVCHVWLDVCDAHYVYVYKVEENGLGVYQVWQPIRHVYGKDKG